MSSEILQANRALFWKRRLVTLAILFQATFLRQLGVLRLAGLFGILLFAFWMGMSPHWEYPYPLHVDEWFHIGYGQSTLFAGSLQYISPYEERIISFHPEMGFHLLWAILKAVTGLTFMEIYRLAPGFLLVLLAFFAYAAGRRGGYGWGSALFVAVIPTSLWTLGPAFVVPVSTAMLFIPLTILLINIMSDGKQSESLWLLLILVGGTLFVHPTTEAVVTAMAGLYMGSLILDAIGQKQYRNTARLLVTLGFRMLVPVVALGIWLPSLSQSVIHWSTMGEPTASALFWFPHGLKGGFVDAFGKGAILLGVVGVVPFITRGAFSYRNLILPLVTLILVAFLFLYPRYFLGPPPLFNRGWPILGLLLAIFAGYAIATYFQLIPTLTRFAKERFRVSQKRLLFFGATLWLIGLATVLFILVTSLFVNERRREYGNYYHVVNETVADYYEWIGKYAGHGGWVAMAEPSMGWAYPPIGGTNARAFLPDASPYTHESAKMMRSMAASSMADVDWLRKNNITLFYACYPAGARCVELSDPGLIKVRRGVYYVTRDSR
jgi:hypothetical protein